MKKSITSLSSRQCQIHKTTLQKISKYQVRGSLTYLFNKKKVYVRFLWQQYSPKNYHLLITNPLGTTVIDLKIHKKVVQLTDYMGKHYLSDNPEVIIYQMSGITIPLGNLCQWILGLPGRSKNFSLDNRCYLSKVTYQQGNLIWVVDYQEYSSEIGLSLPKRLELKQNNHYIKIKIDSWSFK